MSLKYFEEKNIFLFQYLFILLSQYHKQKCLVCNGPNADNTCVNVQLNPNHILLINRRHFNCQENLTEKNKISSEFLVSVL